MDAFRAGFVYVEDCYAGTLSETEDGYRFAYDADYLSSENPRAVSLTLPLRDEPYDSSTLFSFFDGLIPEGLHCTGCAKKIVAAPVQRRESSPNFSWLSIRLYSKAADE